MWLIQFNIYFLNIIYYIKTLSNIIVYDKLHW